MGHTYVSITLIHYIGRVGKRKGPILAAKSYIAVYAHTLRAYITSDVKKKKGGAEHQLFFQHGPLQSNITKQHYDRRKEKKPGAKRHLGFGNVVTYVCPLHFNITLDVKKKEGGSQTINYARRHFKPSRVRFPHETLYNPTFQRK